MTDLVKLLLLEPEKNELAEELWKPVRSTPTLGRIASVSRAERMAAFTERSSRSPDKSDVPAANVLASASSRVKKRARSGSGRSAA